MKEVRVSPSQNLMVEIEIEASLRAPLPPPTKERVDLDQ
jgi:hypothetical protein